MNGWPFRRTYFQDERGGMGGMLMALGSLGIIFVVATIGWTILLNVPYRVLFSAEERQKLMQEAEQMALEPGAVPSAPTAVPSMLPPVGGPATAPAPGVAETPSALTPILTWRVGPEGVGKSVEQLAMEKQQAELEAERRRLERLRGEIQVERANLEAERAKLDAKLNELKAVLSGTDSVRAGRVDEMVKIYSAMRPPQAAQMLQALANREQNLTIVAEVIRNMKDRQAGRVMAAFDTSFSAQIGQIIGNPFQAIE